MEILQKGRYRARFARTAEDVVNAQCLRYRCFRQGPTKRRTLAGAEALDRDDFDVRCKHILVEQITTGRLVGCYRLLPLRSGAEVWQSYSSQFYDLRGLAKYDGPMAELGRFCIDPAFLDPDIIRIAWGALTSFVDENRIGMLFGCSSFRGANAALHRDAFALLREKYLAPEPWLPRIKASAIVSFRQQTHCGNVNLTRAMKGMPPLLRTYLMMGGWVSDHAVIDRDLDTIHVFTALEVKRILPARARLFRAISA